MSTFKWKDSRPSLDKTHHISNSSNTALYSSKFHAVLPFHPPGYAPASDSTGAFHINECGSPIYNERFRRTFGFYDGLASVIDKDGYYLHITPDGLCAYKNNVLKFDWCGNFQEGRCVVRTSCTRKASKNEYYHINKEGEFIQGGPYEYTGDFREGSAVVRDKLSGLCFHVDWNGKKLYSHPGYLDLDVFHKSYARAKDSSGWFHIDEKGRDASKGNRYLDLEPFYNGMALAKFRNGDRVVIDESNMIATSIKGPPQELPDRLQSLFVGFWPSFALKLGLEMGMADSNRSDLATKFPDSSFQALQAAWLELGLLSIDPNGQITLSETGKLLKPGLPDRDRADYWLGIQMRPWLDASQRFLSPPSHSAGNSFFDTLSPESMDLCQRTLYTYAKDDWAEIVESMDFSRFRKVVDIGGGFGFLAKSISEKFPNLECVVIEKPEVVELHKKYVKEGRFLDAGVSLVPGDLFSGDYPLGDVYIISRVLHDWSDVDAHKILSHLKKKLPKEATLLVIERLKFRAGTHGTLQLNMLLTTGGTERSEEEFKNLFAKSGWIQKSILTVNSNCVVMTLQQQ